MRPESRCVASDAAPAARRGQLTLERGGARGGPRSSRTTCPPSARRPRRAAQAPQLSSTPPGPAPSRRSFQLCAGWLSFAMCARTSPVAEPSHDHGRERNEERERGRRSGVSVAASKLRKGECVTAILALVSRSGARAMPRRRTGPLRSRGLSPPRDAGGAPPFASAARPAGVDAAESTPSAARQTSS